MNPNTGLKLILKSALNNGGAVPANLPLAKGQCLIVSLGRGHNLKLAWLVAWNHGGAQGLLGHVLEQESNTMTQCHARAPEEDRFTMSLLSADV